MKNLLTTLVIAFLLGSTVGFAQEAADKPVTPQLQKVDADGRVVAQPAVKIQQVVTKTKTAKTTKAVTPADAVQTKTISKSTTVSKTEGSIKHACAPGCTKSCCSAKAKKACASSCSKSCCRGKRGKSAKSCKHSSKAASAAQPSMEGPKPADVDKK